MACEVWIVGTEGSLDFWTTIKLVLDISFAGSSVLVVSADASSEGALAAASLAACAFAALAATRSAYKMPLLETLAQPTQDAQLPPQAMSESFSTFVADGNFNLF